MGVAPAGGGRIISVVIPTHNRASLLRRAIDSALDQRCRPGEIVVVDDGSTDGTPDVLRAYGERIRVIRKRQGGVSSARNVGVRESAGEFVAFLDSDDYWDPGHLERIDRALAETRGAAALYFSDIRLSSQRGGRTIWERSGFAVEGTHELRRDTLDWLLLPRQPMMIPASVVSRDVYLAVGGSDERLTCRGDTHLFFKLGLAGPLCAVAGEAGEATSDDARSLTRAFAGYDETYVNCTVWLFTDVLERMDGARPEHRRVVERRIAAAHWDIARSGITTAPWVVPRHLASVLRHDPGMVPERVGNLLRRWLRAPFQRQTSQHA